MPPPNSSCYTTSRGRFLQVKDFCPVGNHYYFLSTLEQIHRDAPKYHHLLERRTEPEYAYTRGALWVERRRVSA